ncbi:MAG: pitrilysin family protein [Bacteroidota bacterium]
MKISEKKIGNVLLVLLIFLFITQLNAQSDAKYVEGKVYRHVLDNGLTVLTMERHIAPLIYHQLTYKVGSRNEKLGITGISHVVEHMMFKGTQKYGKGAASETISSNSGIFNAFTSNDMTSYYEYLPADKIEIAMDIESDRMQNCIFNPEEFKSEIEVIIQERRMRSESKANGIMREIQNSMIFYSHPNRDPIIGWPSDLKHVTRDDAYSYYKTYYTPKNAFLVLVGDFETDKIVELVKKYYGNIPAGPDVPEIWAVQESQKVRKSFTLKHSDFTQPSLRMAFIVPNYLDPDAAVLRIAGMILCEKSRDARLYKKLVEEKSIVSSVAGGFGISKDPTIFQISTSVKPDSNVDKVEKLIWEEIESMKKDAVTDHELQKAKNRFKFNQATSYVKNANIGTRISSYETYFGYDFLDVFNKRVLDVTKDDIIRVMSKYFNEDQVTVAYGVPKEGADKTVKSNDDDEDIDADKEGFFLDGENVFNYQMSDEEISIIESSFNTLSGISTGINKIEPLIKSTKLKNGITLYMIENHLDPTISIIGLVETGFIPENLEGEKPGVCDFLGSVMNRATKELNYEQLSERMAFVPYSFSVSGNYKSFNFQGNSLVENSDEMMKTGFDLVTEPPLNESDIEKIRPRLLLNAKNRFKSTSIKAFYYMYNKIFEDHPLSKYMSTEESIKGMTKEDLESLHKKYFQPQNTTLLMVGDMKPEQMKELADKYFGSWQNSSDQIVIEKIPAVKELKGKEIKIFTEKDYAESTINIGFAPYTNVNEDDQEIVDVMNYILAGSALTSRMGVELRDKQGLIYGIKSELWSISEGIGYWKFNTKTAPENTEKVIKGIFSEIRKLFESGVTDEELQTAKQRRLGLLPFFVETPDDVASKVIGLIRDKKPFDYFDKTAERIQRVTKEDVLRVAKKYFTLDRFVIVVDGPLEENALDGLVDQL